MLWQPQVIKLSFTQPTSQVVGQDIFTRMDKATFSLTKDLNWAEQEQVKPPL